MSAPVGCGSAKKWKSLSNDIYLAGFFERHAPLIDPTNSRRRYELAGVGSSTKVSFTGSNPGISICLEVVLQILRCERRQFSGSMQQEDLMVNLKSLVVALAVFLFAGPAIAGSPIVYPAKGQTPQQQDRDQYECHRWAVQQSGFDPSNPGSNSSGTQPANSESRPKPLLGRGSDPNALRGGARGAALGAVGGAIAGDAGKGAAVGAGVGGLGGAIRRRDQQSARESAPPAKAPVNPGLDTYNRAVAACMTGRGYSVN